MELQGITEPRVFTHPLRKLTRDTTLGYDVIDFARDVLGVELFPWETWLLVHGLELDDGGRFRFRTVVVLVARQNGKTLVSKVIALFFLYVLGVSLIIGTSLTLDQAEEVWDGVVDMTEENDELRSEVERVSRTNGNKALELTGDRRYKVKAATRKGGRGLSGDLILLDELREHQTWEAWGAVTKTTLARPDALVWCMSNAGDATSVVLRDLRAKAHIALGDPDGTFSDAVTDSDLDGVDDDTTLGIFEWSADPTLPIDSDLALRQANPSLGYGLLTTRALRSAMHTDPEEVFRTECLCQWVTKSDDTVQPFPEGAWEAGTDPTSEIAAGDDVTFGVDVGKDRQHVSIAACGRREDGSWHVEVVARGSGIAFAVRWLTERAGKTVRRIAYQGRGAPVSSMATDLDHMDGMEAVPCVGRDVAAWCGRFWDAVASGAPSSDVDSERVYHRPQEALDVSAMTAITRPMGDGAWAFDRGKSPEDISALWACVMAFGLATAGTSDERIVQYQSAYSDRDEESMVVVV